MSYLNTPAVSGVMDFSNFNPMVTNGASPLTGSTDWAKALQFDSGQKLDGLMPGGSSVGGGNGMFSGMNGFQKVNSVLGGIQSLGGLYMGLKQLSLANKQFAFQKDFANTNLANQIKSYNTTLADRSRSRASIEGQSQEQAQSYIDQNKMADKVL